MPDLDGPLTLGNPPALYDPAANGYSHLAIVAPGTRLVLCSGQGGEARDGTLPTDFATQMEQALDNVAAALEWSGASWDDVARLMLLIVDHDESRLQGFIDAIDRRMPGAMKPACTLIPVPRLALDGMLVEIEATAAVTTR